MSPLLRTPAILLALASLATWNGTPVSARTGSTSIVVELFTSQGCSSCPPADELLARLGAERTPDGVDVIPLSFHVDYWNYIGWTDPFSSVEWSNRQRRYATVMGLDTVYTPQLVIHGSSEVVGSNAAKIERGITRAQRDRASTAVGVSVDLVAAEEAANTLHVDLATHVEDAIPSRGLDLVVALFEKRLVTPISAGENATRTLRNDYVVRALRRGHEIEGRLGHAQSGSLSFDLEPRWQKSQLGVAAFAQDPATLRIYGAAAASVN